MKIVCGTDFSQHSTEAADVAAALGARLNETLALVHVFEPAHYKLLPQNEIDDLSSRSRAKLKKEAARLRKMAPTVEAEFLKGSAPDALAEFAAKSQARLLVVSSLGHIAPSRWLVGSVAERVAQMSSVPTLVVRGSEAFRSWAARGGRALNVLVASDFSESSDAALRWVSELRKIGPCTVTLASVSWPPQERNRLGIAEGSWFPDNPPEVQKVLERDLRAQCERILGDHTAQIRVAATWGRPEPQILDMAQAEAGTRSIPVFQRVLVPTDFSAIANRAVPFAYSTLYRGGAVCLFHVLEQTTAQTKGRNASRGVMKLEDQLRALIPSEAEARWIVTKVEVAQSREPAKAICQAAERFGADLICIGSHGRSGLFKAILGSVAQGVMARSHRPVLVIRPPGEGT